jgi:RNA polymerase sigma-70 factor (ECF subfamily)
MDDETDLNAAMERYADGEVGAFAALYAALEARLRRFFLRLGASPTTAADLCQETFLRVHRARGSFARGSALLPWVYAIGRNVFIDHTRTAKRRRREQLAATDEPVSEPPDPRAATGEQATIAAQLAGVVERTLAGIPKAQREAFVLVRYEGLSMDQAAEVLGTTKTAVKLRAFRAYEALRAALAEPGGDES